MASRKIKIDTKPVANSQATGDERIIGFSSPEGGGLIAFRRTDDGYLVVDVYREDETVLVRTAVRHHAYGTPNMLGDKPWEVEQ